MTKVTGIALALLLSALAAPPPAHAQPPAEVTADYDFFVGGFRIAEVGLKAVLDKQGYKAQSSVTTRGVLDVLLRGRAASQAVGMRGDFGQRGQAARIPLHRHHAPRPPGQQRPGQAAGTGADLQHVVAGQVAGGAGDPGGQVQVEQEVLPQRPRRGEIVGAHHLGEGGQAVDGAHVAALASAMARAARRASMKLRGSAVFLPARS